MPKSKSLKKAKKKFKGATPPPRPTIRATGHFGPVPPEPKEHRRVDWEQVAEAARYQAADFPDDPWVRLEEYIWPATVTQLKKGTNRHFRPLEQWRFRTTDKQEDGQLALLVRYLPDNLEGTHF